MGGRSDGAPALPSPPALEFHDLTVAYHTKPVLWDVDLCVPEERLVAVVGPNGAGKSTLLKAALGLVPLSSGYVRVFGRSYAEERSRVAYVPQRESVDWDFPASVFDVVLMGRYGRLSGGQQQRTFLARALAQDADLYLMDEPFAGVDAVTERAIIALLRELRDRGRTVVCVHHDLQTVREYFDWVILLNMRLVASGPIDEAFSTERLQATYGGRLGILETAATQLLKEREGRAAR